MTREECIDLVKRNVKNRNLVNHMIAVGAIMRGMAERFGEDPDLWEAVGILHDVDYET
ncbi:HD domain-containing protein, partial [Candidatus Bathyarchaeota archaeon]|nr:HD domain-containing protein [Candidatus Bathyarchaeota archaeon]